MHESPKHKTTFGYLSAIYSAEHGYFGGYLLVSPLGRPLEFHCSAPVSPNRAQQILYGPSLEPYLLGEQIGGNLLAAAKLTPSLILTDCAHFEALKDQMKAPLVLVPGESWPTAATRLRVHTEPQSDASSLCEEEPGSGHPVWSRAFVIGSHWLQLPIGAESQRGLVAELLATLTERVELTEPFERIHEAIREAQRIGARGAEPHGQAA